MSAICGNIATMGLMLVGFAMSELSPVLGAATIIESDHVGEIVNLAIKRFVR
jgi:hypothetical protein